MDAEEGKTEVDDRDSRVIYSREDWQHHTGLDDILFLNHTVSTTCTGGAEIKFTFKGNQISVYGIAGTHCRSNYQSETLYEIDNDGVIHHVNTEEGGMQRLYLSPVLADGQHTLHITNYIDETFYGVDYFLIQSSTTQNTSSSTIPSSITAFSSTSTSVSTDKEFSSTPTYTLTSPLNENSPNKPSDSPSGNLSTSSGKVLVGAVLGSIFAVLGIIGLIIACFFCLRKRQARKQDLELGTTDPYPIEAMRRVGDAASDSSDSRIFPHGSDMRIKSLPRLPQEGSRDWGGHNHNLEGNTPIVAPEDPPAYESVIF